MSTNYDASFAATIRVELKRLREETSRVESKITPIEPDRAIGRLSRLDAMQAQEIKKASLEKLRRRIEALEHALKRAALPEFGICEECGEPIPRGRLLAVPEARLCVSCKE